MAKKRVKADMVKESNAIARAQLSPPADSVWEERIIGQVAAFNRVLDREFPETAFMIGQLVGNNKKRISTRQIAEIQKAAESLIQTYFTIRYGWNKFKTFAVFDFIEYDSGIISAKLNPSLQPYYLELKEQFAVRSLPEFRELTSIYSQQFYRFLNTWSQLSEATISIEELHQLTNAPPSLRSNFANFKVRVLEVAHREINAKTSLKFSWEPKKQGRKVTKVRFVFSSQTL